MRAFGAIRSATMFVMKDPQVRSYVAGQVRDTARDVAAKGLWTAGEFVTDKIAATFNASLTPSTSATFNSFSPGAMQEQESNRYRT
jgi:hypothetical protein